MPAGFGVYVKEEDKIPELQQVLSHVPLHAGTVDELTKTATAGVNKLRESLTPSRAGTSARRRPAPSR